MRTHKPWFHFLAAICLSISLHAQPKAAATRHMLWKVQGRQNSVYLLGSIHMLKKSDYPLAAPLETAFSNAAIVAFETDFAAFEDPAVILRLRSQGRLPEGRTLKTELSARVYRMWTKHLTESGLQVERFEALTPMAAVTAVGVLEMKKLGYEAALGVDDHFFALARQSGKRIVPLETADVHIAQLTGFTKKESERFMESMLKQSGRAKKELPEMFEAWRTGDVEKSARMLNALRESPAVYKQWVTDRNRNWLPKVEELARGNQNAVVIVGAGHLFGKGSLVELLRKKGWKVTQE